MMASPAYASVRSSNLIDFARRAIEMAEAIVAGQEPASRVSLHELQVNLYTNNHRFRGYVAQRLADQSPQRLGVGQLSVAVLSPDDSPVPLPPVWGESVYHPHAIDQLLKDTPFKVTFFHDCALWQVFDHEKRFGVQWMRGSADLPGWESSAPLRVFLHWCFNALQMRLTHAGTLGIQGQGVLLTGQGGSGKSGTVAGGIMHGLDSVGDDYVLVDQRQSCCFAFPLFKTIKQDLIGLNRLGLESQIADTREPNWQQKFEFTSEELVSRPLVNQLAIRALVLPRISGRKHSRFTEVSPQRAMLSLAPTNLSQLPGDRQTGAQFFSSLVRSLPCYELTLSQNPIEIAVAIRDFLSADCA